MPAAALALAAAALLCTLTTAAVAVSIVALFRATATRRRRLPDAIEPISVLKPLRGADDALERNLESFFAQQHPDFELVFGVEGRADAAIAVVERLRARHPRVRAKLVVHDGRRGLNPKVSNLRAMLAAGAHDVVVISDSNVAVAPDYLVRLAGQLGGPPRRGRPIGLVTNLIAGTGERTLGSALENLHLNGAIAGSVAGATAAGEPAVVGKSMMFRRSVLESLGGLESVATLLAEDYVIGRMFAEAGFAVVLCNGVIDAISERATVKAFLQRQLRWSLLRSRLKPLVYPFEPLLNPMAVALAAIALGAPALVVAVWAVGLVLARDALGWSRLRGLGGLAAALSLAPLKDLLLVGVWAAAPFVRHVSWRGTRLRISAGTRLYAEAPVAARARQSAPNA